MSRFADHPRVLWGGWLVPGASAEDRVIEQGAIALSSDKILAVGTRDAIIGQFPDAIVEGSQSHAILPGLINAHHHSWAATPVQHGRRDQPLEPWILAGKSMRQSDAYLDTLVSAARLLGSGITTVVDAYFGGGTTREYADSVVRGLAAYEQTGMRVAFSTGVDTQSFLVWGKGEDARFIDSLPAELREEARGLLPRSDAISGVDYIAVIAELHERHRGNPRIDVWFGPGGPHWMPDELLTAIAEKAQAIGTRVQTHCVETVYERAHGSRFYGKPTILHLRDLGFLGPWLSLAHGIWVTRDEIAALAESDTSIVHNPSSNLRLRAGIAPVLDLRQAGITVGLGMDGFGINDDEDLFAEMRLTLHLHGAPPFDSPALTPRDVLAMATTEGARILGKSGSLGRLAPGYLADLVVLDMRRITAPWTAPEVDIVDLIVSRARRDDVVRVVIAGETVLADGRPTRFDAEAAAAEAAAVFQRQPFRAERDALVRRLAPYFFAWYAGWEGADPPVNLYSAPR
jgi:cytosine/adenosine deaminase-related metal-dependent hydrolase